MAIRYRLVMQRGPQVGAAFELDSPLVSLGRYAGNTISIADEQISRHHARLKRTEQGYSIEDLKSANGLYINNTRVTTEATLLQPGDKIRLGRDIVFVYETFTAYDVISAFAGVVPVEPAAPVREVSDTGGTVFMPAVDFTPGHSPEAAPPPRQRLPWLSIGVGIAIVVVIVFAAIVLFVPR